MAVYFNRAGPGEFTTVSALATSVGSDTVLQALTKAALDKRLATSGINPGLDTALASPTDKTDAVLQALNAKMGSPAPTQSPGFTPGSRYAQIYGSGTPSGETVTVVKSPDGPGLPVQIKYDDGTLGDWSPDHLRPVDTGTGMPPAPLDKTIGDLHSLASASPAAQAIMSHASLTPNAVSALGPPAEAGPTGDDVLAGINASHPQFSAQDQAAAAIRAHLADYPNAPQGLTDAEYQSLPDLAKGDIKSWVGGAGTAPTGIAGKHISRTVTTMKNGAPQTQSVYADDGGHEFMWNSQGNLEPFVSAAQQARDDIAAADAADRLPAKVSNAQDQLSMLSGLSGPASYLGVRPDQANDLRAAIVGPNADKAMQAIADRTSDAGMVARGSHYVDPREALANGGNPGWTKNGPVQSKLSPADQATYAQNAATYPAREGLREALAAQARTPLVKQGQTEQMARKLRLEGTPYLLAAGMTGNAGGGNSGFNPYVAAAVPQLGEEMARGAGIGIGQQNANANTTQANAFADRSRLEGDEFALSQTPLGLARSLSASGQPVPPELAQAAAAQALRGMQQNPQMQGGAQMPAAAKLASVPKSTDGEPEVQALLNGMPAGGDMSDAARAIDQRLSLDQLNALQKKLDPNRFTFLNGGWNPFDPRYKQLGQNHGVLNRLGILPSETPEQAEIRNRELALVNKAIGQFQGAH